MTVSSISCPSRGVTCKLVHTSEILPNFELSIAKPFLLKYLTFSEFSEPHSQENFHNYFYFNQADFLVLSSIVMNDRRSKYV